MGHIRAFHPLLSGLMHDDALTVAMLGVIPVYKICYDRAFGMAVISRNCTWLQDNGSYLNCIALQCRDLSSQFQSA